MILVEWFRQLGRAFRNVARLSRRNPIWAITALTLSPIALIRHLFGVAMLFLIVGLVFGLGMPLILGKLLSLPRDSLIYQAVMILAGLVVILVTLRALFQPLILHYGGPDSDDTHGSARSMSSTRSASPASPRPRSIPWIASPPMPAGCA